MKYLDSDRAFFIAATTVLAIVIGLVFFYDSQPSQVRQMETALWQDYKVHIWDSATGRTVDAQDDGVTTSEGQAYTLLRAVWENDPSTFATTWDWTSKNLQRSDKLFSWRWGKRADGTTGILTSEGGQNTASDADTDIAFALLMASNRWHNQSYLTAARQIIHSIWQIEVVSIQGRPYLSANNVEKMAATPSIIINPSYFAPYAYRSFALIDTSDHWQELVSDSYLILSAASKAPLDTEGSDGLPPNWLRMDRQTGVLQAVGNNLQNTQFGFDAFRTVWRTALDWQWYHDPRAKQALANFIFLHQQWQLQHKLMAVYDHNGHAAVNYESVALYGGVLGYFQLFYPTEVKAILRTKLEPLYSPSKHHMATLLNYYDNSWAWFGLSLYGNNLPNLASKGGSF